MSSLPSNGAHGSRTWGRLIARHRGMSLLATLAVMVTTVPAAVVLSAVPASAFTQGSSVTTTLEGCRNDGTITLPNADGKFICPDAVYTTGNLGKGWNELDLVPHRLTTNLGNQSGATTTYDLYVAADNVTNGKTGYDVISVPVVNTSKSDASCTVNAGAQSFQGDATTPFGSGTDTVTYRQLTIHQNTGTKCVFDYYLRLALGSHLYPGSSLQSYEFDQSGLTGGKSTISIPVNQIAPQALKKDSNATQNSSWTWNITKQASPTSIDFGNTCSASTSTSHGVTITVSWQKLSQNPDGSINIVTNVYARNPASRPISVKATDTIYSDPVALSVADEGTWPGGPAPGAVTVSTASTDGNPHAMSAFVSVPGNTDSQLLFTTNIAVAADATNLYDVATAQYQDDVTHVAVPGISSIRYPFLPSLGQKDQPPGTDDLTGNGGYLTVGAGTTLNSTATIVDTEHLVGSAFSYSVDTVTPNVGTFSNSYVTGTHTTADVTWTLSGQSASGSVAFAKTVYVNGPVNATGTLSDSATLTGSDGFTPTSTNDTPYPATASVDLTSSATGTLDVSKTTSLTLDQSTDFVFHLFDAATSSSLNKSMTVTMPAGRNGDGTPVSDTPPTATTPISGLDVTKHYYLNEDAVAPYAAQRVPNALASPNYIAFNLVPGDLSSCTVTVSVNNNADPATAQVKKATLPTSSGNWTFTLSDNGTVIGTLTNVVANASSYAPFLQSLDQDGHTYTITETQQAGYDLTNVIGDVNSDSSLVAGSISTRTCSFTLDLTRDSGHTFECTFTNTHEGTIIVKKVTDPTTSTDTFAFTGDAHGSIGNNQTIEVDNLVPGTYTSTEADPTPGYDLTSISCDDGSSVTPSTGSTSTRTATFKLDPGETITCTFTNRQRGHAKVVKTVNGAAPSGAQSFVFQLRSGASASAAGTILESGTANAADGGVINFATYLVPGTTYQLCEQMMPGWMTTLGPPFFTVYNPSGDNSVVCTDFTVTAGQTKEFDIDNTPPPGGRALTIGFWKNWASCANSNGKQKPVLDQALLAAAQAGQPITIGKLVLNPTVLGATVACQDAVDILNKSTLSGKKMSSDPLFNMAAQLLAADLNVAAGAGTCPAAVTAINSAQALLVKYSFNGSTYSPKLTSTDATAANSLANSLDKYNNNLLC